METFVPFTATRKAMIVTTKGLLTNPDNLKLTRNSYGNRIKHLFFEDYLTYAVLRGTDFRKASHPEGYDKAISELKSVAATIGSYIKDEKGYHSKFATRYLPAENAKEAAVELKTLIDEAIAKAAA